MQMIQITPRRGNFVGPDADPWFHSVRKVEHTEDD